MCYQTTAFLPLSPTHNTFSHTVKASGRPRGIQIYEFHQVLKHTQHLTHTHMEALTFECVFVKSAPLRICLSENGGDFSDNGLMTPIDSICGQWNKGPGVHQQTSD